MPKPAAKSSTVAPLQVRRPRRVRPFHTTAKRKTARTSDGAASHLAEVALRLEARLPITLSAEERTTQGHTLAEQLHREGRCPTCSPDHPLDELVARHLAGAAAGA